MMIFENIRNVSMSDSWEDKVFLTFDTEWANDEILSYMLNIILEANIKATFFCTHRTKLLERMRKNNKIELGIHPNFNFLLKGDFRYGRTYDEVVRYFKDIVPEAVSARSHCLVQGTQISEALKKNGLDYEVNILIPNRQLSPWQDTQTIKVPYGWEDDTHCLFRWEFNMEYFLKRGIKIFNFHPLFIYLNAEDIKRYEVSKEFYSDCKRLRQNRYTGYGMENMLRDLILKVKSKP